MDNKQWKMEYGDWNVYQSFYGSAECVEADAVYEEDLFRVLLCLNYSAEGGYGLRISQEDGRQLALIFKNTIRYVGMAYAYLDDFGIQLRPGQQFHVALCKNGNVLSVELNGKELIRHEDAQIRPEHTVGKCGYVVYPIRRGTTRVENFAVTGEAAAMPEVTEVPKPAPYTYVMELPVQEGALPACWMRHQDIESFGMKNGKLTSPNTEYVESLLYQFDNEPKLTVRFAAEELASDGEFGFLLRKAPQTAFVKVAYSVQKGHWYVQDVPALYDCYIQTFEGTPWTPEPGREYTARLEAVGDWLTMHIDGENVLSASGLRQTNHGKTGLFSQNAVWNVCSFEAEFASGVAPADGAVSSCVDEQLFQASMELEVLADGTLVGITKEARYKSTDRGISFQKASEEYAGLDVKKYYQTILRIHDGSYLQVLAHTGGQVQRSTDLKNWKTIGMLGDAWETEQIAQEEYIFHVGTMTEIPNPAGGWRLFMPMAVQTSDNQMPVYCGKTHDTLCYFSDDGGRTWEKSEFVEAAFGGNGGYRVDWAENKVLDCDDGTLRLYCSRNCSRFLTALISRDFGRTWSEVTPIRQIQCSKASFGMARDPYNPKVWYVACVNDVPLCRGHLQCRTRLSLYRTHNGRDWEFLTDVERFGLRFLDEPDMENRPLYQILDPTVNVDEKYVYVTWGASLYGARGSILIHSVANPAGSGRVSHNEQRAHVARFEKAALKAQPWSSATVADLSLLTADISGEMW